MDLRDQLQHALGSSYRLERELGQGGMSTVYLADDLKHDRKVAVKVLRPELAAALGADRFTREIRIAARLQHPHILPLLDSGQAEGFLYYVMPYVEGQSLRDRLGRQGELPVHEAVRLLVEITDALAFAHAQGVVHRDIKPDNILLSGRHALVMDFGVAKAVSEATGRHSLTTAGVALGTPAYMAPEQATADPNLDHRVDIYAVGVMGYELLTGRTPFAGLSPQRMLAAHVTEEPAPLSRYRPSLSPALQSVVMRCLAKHPADRWQTAQELLTQLEPLMTPSGGMTPAQTQPVAAGAPGAPAAGRARRWPWIAAGAAALALVVGAAGVLAGRHPAELALGRRTQVTRDPGLEMDPAISPDGKLVAYAAGPAGDEKIFVRQIDGGGTIALTPGAPGDLRRPQWTPDGSRLAFQSPRGIELVPAFGGVPKVLVPSPLPDTVADLAWSPDGERFVYRSVDSLFVRATGGGPARKLVGGHEVYAPAWSPDGHWIAYVAGNPMFLYGLRSQIGNIAPSAVMVVSAEGGTPVQVAGDQSQNLSPIWLPHGRELLFISNRDGGRDIYRVRLSSGGQPEAPPERLTTGLNASTISLTADGRRLAYSTFTQVSNVWALAVPKGDPVSSRTARPVTSGNQLVESFDVSPDGKWLAFDSDRNGNQDIFRKPLPDGPEEQLTSDPGDDFQPSFSRDGRYIGFHAFRSGSRDLFVMPASGGEQRAVVANPGQDRDAGWSPDGRRMSFASDITGRSEVYTIARQGDGWAKPIRLTRDGGIFPFWSPDGRYIMFAWTSGAELVPADGGEARPFPLAGPLAGKQVEAYAYSWAPDGRHAFMVFSSDTAPYQTLWSVPVDSGRPRPLIWFDDPLAAFGRGAPAAHDSTIYFALLRSESDVWTAEMSAR
jgi:eukaryotic-like serine/threonine-protein kinase